MTWPTIESHSAKVSGRLSSADGSRNPYSTSGIFRERSPPYMPPIWGTATWDSSTTTSASSGRKSSRQKRPLALGAAAEVPGVVLDAGAGAGLAHHLEVEVGALQQALRLEQPAARLELGERSSSSSIRSSAILSLSAGVT